MFLFGSADFSYEASPQDQFIV
uniref:Uncharacterized protein n=1 Tax=Rhizophora mucronata TaxID=61149 RepID=A0A2P2QYA1_RHIMU